MRHWATLFDKNYLSKGLALHESMLRHCQGDWTLHVLAMDSDTQWLLTEMELPHVNVLPYSSFEYALNLKGVRENRTWTEYCWTCASSLVEYLLPWTGADITYLDSDLMLFADPQVVFDEIGKRSIGITPHRFPPAKKYMEKNGVYNVGWVTIRNTEAGRKCAATWARQCREWCYAQNLTGKFGDQKYLDTWEADYPGEVCSIAHIGVNAAPWNISNFKVTEGPQLDGVPLVAYHFHEYSSDTLLTHYALRDSDIEHIYKPYIAAWMRACDKVRECQKIREQRVREMAAQRDSV